MACRGMSTDLTDHTAFKKLRQREWKGREIAEQNIRNEAQMRLVDDESGLREFSTPEAAEPTWQAPGRARAMRPSV